MAFYGTSATGAGWIVPKKYIEKVGDDGFKKAPVGAGPYKFVSFNPGVELVLEAFHDYWRKAPAVKRLVMRSIPDETTRAAALKTGEVDVAYLLRRRRSPRSCKRTPGLRIAAPLALRHLLARLPRPVGPEVAVARPPRAAGREPRHRPQGASTRPRCSGFGKPTGAFVPPRRSTSRCRSTRPPTTPSAPSSCSPRPAIRTASTPATSRRCRPTPRWARRSRGYLQAVGIRTRVRTMERAAFLTALAREEAARAADRRHRRGRQRGHAARAVRHQAAASTPTARCPEIDDLFQRQARELDRKQREALLHQIQQIVADQMLVAPIFQQAFIWGVGPRVEEPARGPDPGLPVRGALRGPEAEVARAATRRQARRG